MKKLLLRLLFIFLLTNGNIFAQVADITNPENQTVTEGQTATFSISILSGTAPFSYQWQASFDQSNFVNVANANSEIYTTSETNLSMDGIWYRCVVSNDSGVTNSNHAVLTVAVAAPTITSQPVDQNIEIGQSATFNLSATGSGILSYQWYANSTPIPGATFNFFTTEQIPDMSFDETVFYCIVNNTGGSVESNEATLYVTSPTERVSSGLLALYNFKEGSGTIIEDESGVGSPLDLRIENPNGIQWTPNGLNVGGQGKIKSNDVASKLINSCTTTNEVTFEAWLLPTDMIQRNIYARIMTLSNDQQLERNLALFQNGDDYSFNVRTTNTSLNGEPTTSENNIQALTHVVYTRDLNSNTKLYINGVLVSESQVTGDFSSWDSGYYLYLGTEANNTGYWEGTYYLSAFYSRALSEGEVSQNYFFGVDSDNLPYIIDHPENQILQAGQSGTYSVEAIGISPLSYQWKKNGSNISGATNSSYTTPSVSMGDNNSSYSCVVTNSNGSVESNPAILIVITTDERITQSVIAQYTFEEGSGNIINDVSGVGVPINLTINTPNSTNWTHNGLEVLTPANIFSSTAASKIYDLCSISNEFTVETWIKPTLAEQSATRIISYSQDASSRNFSLSQGSDQYEGRVRTTTTSINGYSSVSPEGSINGELQHVVYLFRGDEKALIFVNGVEVSRSTVGGNFSNWTSSYRLSIANELLDSRPWLGTFNYVAIFDRNLSQEEVLHNYNIGPYGVTEIVDPSNLVATTVEVGSVSISWSDNTSNEDGFILERGVGDPTVWNSIDTLEANITNYTDENLSEGVEYSYRCRAFNNFTGTFSNFSNIYSIVTKIQKPSGLVGKADDVGVITILWSDNSGAESGFYIERGEGNPVVFSLIDSVTSNIVSYNDNSVVEGVEYIYRINAFNSLISSEYSNTIEIRSKASFINKPTELDVNLHEVLGVPVLTWNDNAFNENGYIIERRTIIFGSSFAEIDSVEENVTSYTDNVVQDSSSYSYRVYAFNNETVSETSNEDLIDVLVDVSEENGLPQIFGLEQNYPNPFNPTTTIAFNLPEASDVELSVYNLLGQQILTIVNNNYSLGRYSINFDASELTSGVYIYSIVAVGNSGEQFVSSKKLILLK